MSEWEFLWGLEGQELMDAMSFGCNADDLAYLEHIEKQIRLIADKHHREHIHVFIDAENIPAKYYDQIEYDFLGQNKLFSTRVYALQKDQATKGWHEVAEANKDNVKEIRLSGEPKKNKVDQKIAKDILKLCNTTPPEKLLVVIVSSDADFSRTIRVIRAKGSYVCGIGEPKASKKLRDACDRFFELDFVDLGDDWNHCVYDDE